MKDKADDYTTVAIQVALVTVGVVMLRFQFLQLLWAISLILLLGFPEYVDDHAATKPAPASIKTRARPVVFRWSAILQVVLVAAGVRLFSPAAAPMSTSILADGGPIATYTWSAENEGLALAGTTVLRELEDFQIVLNQWKSDDLKDWQSEAITKWWSAHKGRVQLHCQVANDKTYPRLNERISINTRMMAKEHDKVYQYLDSLDQRIQSLTVGVPGVAREIQGLSKEWRKYTAHMKMHLQHEFDQAVLPSRQAYTADEWFDIISEFFNEGSKEGFSSIVHYLGESRFRQEFMKERKIPGFVWFLAFKKQLRYYESHMYKYITALKSGVPHK